MSAQRYNNVQDRKFSPIGGGHISSKRCWKCNEDRQTLGGKLMGPLKLWHCAACVARKSSVVTTKCEHGPR